MSAPVLPLVLPALERVIAGHRTAYAFWQHMEGRADQYLDAHGPGHPKARSYVKNADIACRVEIKTLMRLIAHPCRSLGETADKARYLAGVDWLKEHADEEHFALLLASMIRSEQLV